MATVAEQTSNPNPNPINAPDRVWVDAAGRGLDVDKDATAVARTHRLLFGAASAGPSATTDSAEPDPLEHHMTALVASRGQTECHQLIQQLRHRAQAILDARRDATPETLRAALASSERHAARCEADLERLRGDFAQLEQQAAELGRTARLLATKKQRGLGARERLETDLMTEGVDVALRHARTEGGFAVLRLVLCKWQYQDTALRVSRWRSAVAVERIQPWSTSRSVAELQQELTRTKQELKDAWRESEASWVERDSAQTRVKNAEVEVLSLKRKLGRNAAFVVDKQKPSRFEKFLDRVNDRVSQFQWQRDFLSFLHNWIMNWKVARRELQSCLAWSASTLDHLTKTVKSRVLRLGGCIILRTLGRIIGESLRLRLQTGLAMWFAQANNMTLRQREETPIPRLISLPDSKSERQESLQSQTAIRKIINKTFNNPATSAERAIQAAYQHKLQAVKVNNNHYAHQLGQMITQLQAELAAAHDAKEAAQEEAHSLRVMLEKRRGLPVSFTSGTETSSTALPNKAKSLVEREYEMLVDAAIGHIEEREGLAPSPGVVLDSGVAAQKRVQKRTRPKPRAAVPPSPVEVAAEVRPSEPREALRSSGLETEQGAPMLASVSDLDRKIHMEERSDMTTAPGGGGGDGGSPIDTVIHAESDWPRRHAAKVAVTWSDESDTVTIQESEASPPDPAGESPAAAEAGSLRALFDFMDKNGDGKVSRIEMIQALRKDPNTRKYLGLPAHFRQGSPEHAAFEAVFQRLDADGSREITWAEFVRMTHVDPELWSHETRRELLALGGVESSEGLPAILGARQQSRPLDAITMQSENRVWGPVGNIRSIVKAQAVVRRWVVQRRFHRVRRRERAGNEAEWAHRFDEVNDVRHELLIQVERLGPADGFVGKLARQLIVACHGIAVRCMNARRLVLAVQALTTAEEVFEMPGLEVPGAVELEAATRAHRARLRGALGHAQQ